MTDRFPSPFTTTFRTRKDQFGQIVYRCPICDKGFLTTLADKPPDEATLRETLVFHATGEHPGLTPASGWA